MANEVATSNNVIIEDWTKQYLPKINAAKKSLNIKHRRNKNPKQSKAKFGKKNAEINKIGIGMSKGEIMTHKGKGKYPDNRVEKPWFNPITESEVNALADAIAENTGDIIAGHILIR